MKKQTKVSLFFVNIAIIGVIIAIFALYARSVTPVLPTKNDVYRANIKVLSDTVEELRRDIARYEEQINQLNLEKENLKREIDKIIKANEETDNKLVNGTLDDNVEFLSKYLSENSDE